jgi:hypothetical protein
VHGVASDPSFLLKPRSIGLLFVVLIGYVFSKGFESGEWRAKGSGRL